MSIVTLEHTLPQAISCRLRSSTQSTAYGLGHACWRRVTWSARSATTRCSIERRSGFISAASRSSTMVEAGLCAPAPVSAATSHQACGTKRTC
jgi:hypothetical protein